MISDLLLVVLLQVFLMSAKLLQALIDRDLTDYGSFIEGSFVREILDITLPEFGTRQDFDRASLAELAAIGYVRTQLLLEGNYRILLPSENLRQVEAYLEASDNKRRKGALLLKNTPPEFIPVLSQVEARACMRENTRYTTRNKGER